MPSQSLSPEERIAKLRGGSWIKYPRAEQILDKLEDLLTVPKFHRMPNLLLVGETNNGKTMIVNRFANRHRPDIRVAGGSSHIPVMLIQAPPVPDESRFFNSILTELYTPFRASARVDQRQLQVIRLMDAVGVKMLIIDEIHHILAGTVPKQRHFLNTIKYLGNELMIPIVAVGTRDAFNAVHSDPQLANRFEPALLPKWQMNEEFLRLLASFERILPFDEASNLSEASLAAKVLSISEGTIGEIADLLMRCARHALTNGLSKITLAGLDACGYASPSSRRRPLGL